MNFESAGRKIVVGLLFLAVLTNWVPGRFCTFAFDAGVFLLAAVWGLGRAGRGWGRHSGPVMKQHVHCARPLPDGRGSVTAFRAATVRERLERLFHDRSLSLPGQTDAPAPRRGVRMAGSIVLAPLGGVVLWGLAQLATGNTVYRFETWVAVLDWSALAALFFLSLQLYGDAGARAGLRRAMLYFGFALSVVSVVQLFSSDGKVFWLFPTPYKEFVVGPFLNRDHYACFIELVLPLAVVEAFRSRRNKMAYAAMAGAMLATVIAGASRAGTIVATLEAGVISLAAVWGYGAGTRAASLLRVFALAGVFTAVVGWEVVWQRFQEPDPFKYRREMAISSVAMVRDRPWMGFGLGTYESAYPAYTLFDIGLTVNHAHNDWLEWAAEGGIPLFIMMAFVALWSAREAWRSPWAAGVVGVFLHCMVDYPLHRPAISAWLFVLLGALAAKAREERAAGG